MDFFDKKAGPSLFRLRSAFQDSRNLFENEIKTFLSTLEHYHNSQDEHSYRDYHLPIESVDLIFFEAMHRNYFFIADYLLIEHPILSLRELKLKSKQVFKDDYYELYEHDLSQVAEDFRNLSLKIIKGLKKIEKEIFKNKFKFREQFEDIHLNIEKRLFQIIGDSAGYMHTARSRNDQVVTDFKIWVKDSSEDVKKTLDILIKSILKKAEKNINTVMPGFTHLKNAQPISFAHYLLAYVEMFGRDRGRVADCRTRINENPLGSAALAGTPYPIDRHMTASALGFDRPTANSLDAVSDRDFALEYLNAASIAAMHLSRLAEEMVIWCSAQFRFIGMSDKFSTGSSIMLR